MRAALLSAGPSLRRTFDPDAEYDLRIGVNTAAALFHCDWWSCADEGRFREIFPIGYPALFTISHEHHKSLGNSPERIAKHRVEHWEPIFAATGANSEWASWSCPSALVLAKWLNVTELDIYGVDMAGSADVTGEVTHHRNPDRWQRELVVWNGLLSWLQRSGVKTNRITE